MAIATINPSTGKTEKTFEILGDNAIENALHKAKQMSAHLAVMDFYERASWLINAAKLLRNESDHLSMLITTEMGKPATQAKIEIEKCATLCDYYANEGSALLRDRVVETKASRSFVRMRPIGPVFAVMPWNFPFWQVFRFAAPALILGNTGLLKHASNVPQCALAIEDIWRRAGVPDGAFQTLLVSSEQTGAIINDDRIRGVTLTGSEGAGKAVGTMAGGALKPSVLELGGSDPFIVMPSADMDNTIDMAIKGRTMNNGQSCIAAKRFLIHADIYDNFRERFIDAMGALKIGNPLDEEIDIGPLATDDIRKELDNQVAATIKAGAKRVCGAIPIDGDGWYYQPGILENIPDNAPAYHQEMFGPVASLFKVNTLDEAIELGNTTRFGLGSAIFTEDQGEMEIAFNQLDAGATFVNTITASHPRLPFGGVKMSGYGRELAEEGLAAFANVKTCCIGAAG